MALDLVTELDEAKAEELGLLIPRDDFAQLDLAVCLRHQEELEGHLMPELADCWADFRTRFVVVCGPNIFASRQPVTDFDQVRFDEDKPYYTTVIPRPRTATMVWTERPRVRWLHAVPDLPDK